MPRYLVTRDTWISHQGKLAKAGETVDIEWPPKCEPKKLGDNLQLVDEKTAKPGGKKPAEGGDLA